MQSNLPNNYDICSYLSFLSDVDIYTFGIGVEIFSEDLNSLTVGTGGRHFFKLKDYSNLQEIFDQIIGEKDLSLLFHPSGTDKTSVGLLYVYWG